MRIGIDIRALQSAGRDRGIGYVIRGLLSGLAQAEGGDRHEYVLIQMDRPDLPPRLDIPPGLQCSVVTLPFFKGRKLVWRALKAVRFARWLNPAHALRRRGMRYDEMLFRRLDMALLARAARRTRLDVLHLTSVFESEFWANIGPGFPCPVVQTVYDMIPQVFPDLNQRAGWTYWYMQEMGLRSLAEGPGKLVAISQSARADAERFVPPAKGRIDVVYIGAGDGFAPPADAPDAAVRERYGIGARPYFLTSGGCEWRKNLQTALAAFARFLQREPGYVLLVPSKLCPEDQARVARWSADVGLADGRDVLRTGFVADADMPALYAGAAALIFPSRYEGFGLPVVEAMRCGCPVITVNNSSLGEVAGNAALLVDDADDVAGFEDAMRRIVQEAGLAEALRARGLERGRLFSWEETARQLLGIYGDLAAGSHAAFCPSTRSESEQLRA